MPNYFQIAPIFFDKKIFLKCLPFSCHGNQNSKWNENVLATFNGDDLRINLVKFGEIPLSGLVEDVNF